MWVTGLFEGEGTITVNRGGNTWHVSLGMTDEDVVRRLHKVVGAGALRLHNGKERKKPMLYWRLTDKQSVTDFLEQVYPYLGARRRARAEEALTWLKASLGRCIACTRVYLDSQHALPVPGKQ